LIYLFVIFIRNNDVDRIEKEIPTVLKKRLNLFTHSLTLHTLKLRKKDTSQRSFKLYPINLLLYIYWVSNWVYTLQIHHA